ncbi:hypothetical protein BDR04DRAFT_1099799 [Suillus decipiens]|nr:hypothetical protein BDR04DRAFT_1099799 [Suillus decipiens]
MVSVPVTAKLVISVYIQPLPSIVTDTLFSKVTAVNSSLVILSKTIHSIFIFRAAHPSPRTLIFFSIVSPCTLLYLQRILS